SGNLLDADGLRAEADARRAIGIETTYLARRALESRFGIRNRTGLVSYDDLAVNPRRLTSGYLRAAMAQGARIFAPVEVIDIEASAHGVAAKTRDGPVIRAGHIAFCTGYELPAIVPHTGHHVLSTYAITTAPQPTKVWPEKAFIWEAADPYLYMRTTPDGRV